MEGHLIDSCVAGTFESSNVPGTHLAIEPLWHGLDVPYNTGEWRGPPQGLVVLAVRRQPLPRAAVPSGLAD